MENKTCQGFEVLYMHLAVVYFDQFARLQQKSDVRRID